MHYRVLRDCIISGAKARAGDIVALNDSLANEMMAIGRVVPDTAMPKTSDRQVKEVEKRGNSKTTTRKQSRKPRAASKPSGGDSQDAYPSEFSDL